MHSVVSVLGLAAMMKICWLSFIFLLGLQLGFCDEGSVADLRTVTFHGTVRLPNEAFDTQLNDEESTLRSTYTTAIETATQQELDAHLTSSSVAHANIRASVEKFTEGSVVVTLLVAVEETTMNGNDLGTAMQTITADGSLGAYVVEEAEDVDECLEGSDDCSELANCTNVFGGYQCKCSLDYFDPNQDGSVCVNPVNVTCETNSIKVSVIEDYLKRLSISLKELRLNNETCGATYNNMTKTYDILDDMSSCGNSVKSNETHVTYHNTLSNLPRGSDIIVTGNNISIPFSCVFPRNLSASIHFEGEVPLIDISVEPGEGEFDVDLDLYEDSLFESKEIRRTFKTTDVLNLGAKLNSGDPNLVIVFDKCWATPTSNMYDPVRYDIITDGCEVDGFDEGVVTIITNGEVEHARFNVKVFTFVDESTTYIHCFLAVCSTLEDTCKPSCSSSGRRARSVDESINLSRRRRDSSVELQQKSVGPLYRIEADASQRFNGPFWAVTLALIAMVLVMFIIVGFLVMRRFRRSKEPVVGLSIRPLDDDTVGLNSTGEI